MPDNFFRRDSTPAPCTFTEQLLDVQHWHKMPCDGHFTALEEVGLLATGLRPFFRLLREEQGWIGEQGVGPAAG